MAANWYASACDNCQRWSLVALNIRSARSAHGEDAEFRDGGWVFGALAVYGIINPAKASYLVAPTLAVCSIVGFLTALWSNRPDRSSWLVALVGFLLGISVNFRPPNILLAAGIACFLVAALLRLRTWPSFLDSVAFGAGVVIGMVPTLIAQAGNAAGPVATTYGATDALRAEFQR